MNDSLMTVPQVADYLQVSENTIYGMLQGHKPLPHFRVGRQIRFCRDKVLEHLSAVNQATVGGN